MPNITTVILAAGKSSRFKSRVSKLIYPLCGLPIISHVYSVAKKIKPSCDSFYLMASQDFPRPIWAIHVDAMMASHLTNTPTINGYSGNNPRNYGLWNPKAKNILLNSKVKPVCNIY